MINIEATRRCQLFEEIASNVWAHIIYNHNVRVEVSEIGITNDIIAVIRNHSERIPNFGVWANPGYNEGIHGSDIDVFVEAARGTFVWYAFQAKALKINGRYQDMAGIRGGEYQWDKLERLSKQSGCISQYLLYNGVGGYNYSGTDKCNRPFLAPQFGCSIVDIQDVQNFSTNHNPSFSDFHPFRAQPWRVIVCCKQKTRDISLFSTTQVKKSIEYYNEEFKSHLFKEGDESEYRPNELSVNSINEFSKEADRNPICRVIIRSTSGLSLDRGLI